MQIYFVYQTHLRFTVSGMIHVTVSRMYKHVLCSRECLDYLHERVMCTHEMRMLKRIVICSDVSNTYWCHMCLAQSASSDLVDQMGRHVYFALLTNLYECTRTNGILPIVEPRTP